MKSKTGVILAVVIILLLIVAFFFIKKPGTGPAGGAQTTGSNAFTSIKDALSKSLSLECSFTDEQGRQTKSYMKAGAVRTDFTAAKTEDSGSVIIKDKKMWFWNSAKKEGMMMEVPDVKSEDLPKVTQPQSTEDNSADPSDIMASLEKFKDSCKPGVVSDSLFTPPSDVKFTDYSQMMKDMQKVIPTGTQGGAPQFDQSQVEKMMQQYGNQDSSGQ